jgi:hypothetical protein
MTNAENTYNLRLPTTLFIYEFLLMTDALPPFDPPYITFHGSGSNTHCVETLLDGTTRPIPVPQAASRIAAHYSDTKTKRSIQTTSKLNSKTTADVDLRRSDHRAALYLNVPFAEKEKAKKLGAKWDVAKRKWYVPHGSDINVFKQWWSDDLKVK